MLVVLQSESINTDMKKKETDNKSFDKGIKIATQAIDILSKKSSGSNNELNNFILENKYSKDVIENITDIQYINAIRAENIKARKIESLKKASEKLKNRKNIRRRKSIVISTSISIAAVAMIASFVIFSPANYSNKILSQQSETNSQKILVPTLISGSGKTIEITNNDFIADNATLIDNNTLSYAQTKIDVEKVEHLTYDRIIIPNCYTYTIILSDSSEIKLNAGSELIYPTRFSANKREVTLKGEAYFKVRKSTTPFIVKTSDISIKVYGTEFNINTLGSNSIDALLVEGKIGVKINNSSDSETIMRPNELYSLNRNSGKGELKVVDIENHISWTKNLFKFDNENLDVILQNISNWYGVEFEYQNNKSGSIKIDLKISRNTKKVDIFKAIERVSDIKIINKGGNKYVVE